MKKYLLLAVILLMPISAHAENLVFNGDFFFKPGLAWLIKGHCKHYSQDCVYESDYEDWLDIDLLSDYFKFGQKNGQESITQLVTVPKQTKKLVLKFKLKLENAAQTDYANDSFTVLLTNDQLTKYYLAKDIEVDPNNQRWVKYRYDLSDAIKDVKGKDLILIFGITNDASGVTKASITDINLKHSKY